MRTISLIDTCTLETNPKIVSLKIKIITAETAPKIVKSSFWFISNNLEKITAIPTAQSTIIITCMKLSMGLSL